MTPLKACTAALVLFGSIALADDAQTALARQIEEASVTSKQAFFDTGKTSDAGSGVGWTLYPPLINRHEILVNGCDVTARMVNGHDQKSQEESFIEITFDLTRTRIPDASVPVGNEFAFMAGSWDESYGTALIELHFIPPYEPLIWSNIAGVEVEQPVRFTRFLMEPVFNEEQPRRLLALLNQYKAEYCAPSG
ncbi:hypothetical protein MUY21_15965 [Aliiroseovarius sp. S2029]|uniref:hypothetical protein n=1 Tax=Aliiroseovarius sp. S2029 TaxID=2936988 RepID=UPI0020C0A9E1|nr:hypothetical protein [Aliiroseovarius sp. S2029]MCK8485530.1 hypothetical protein [Aliiroseovarius sp. S2029]